MTKKQLRKKLALMLANLKKKRPYYCEVEYLESTGTQYIDTGFKVDDTCGYKITYMALSADDMVIFGTKGSGDSRWVLSGNNNPNVNLSWNTNYGRSGLGLNKVQTAQMNYLNDRKRFLNDIEISAITETLSSNAGTYNVCMFAGYWGSGTVSLNSTCRIYKAEITKGSDIVRDFIPVLDWDYVPCMYDKVTEQLFYNAGTGSFSYGREIHYVDYLESDGTQYIDTGLNYFADFEVGIKLRNNVSNKALGNKQTNCMERNNATAHNWRFSSNGSWDSNIDLLEYHIMKWKEDKIYADDVLLTEKVKIKNTGYYMTLFGAGAYYPNMIYFCKLWNPDDGTLVRNYIPAIDENGVGFLFDKVSHTIYDNAGTGVFKYPARETEYTANAATYAYIDLGVKYKPSMSIEGKYTRENYGTNGSVMLLTTTTVPPLIYLPALSGYTAERYVWRRSGYTEQSYIIGTITYPFTCEMKVDAVNDTLTLNGDIVKTGMIAGMNGYDDPYESASNMYMFSIANSYAGNGKVYYLKITDGTTPLFDLIPAYKDGEAGFYNKVDGTFYKNAATRPDAKLTAGKIVEPEYE